MFGLCMHVCRFFFMIYIYGNHSLTVSRLEHWSVPAIFSAILLSFFFIYLNIRTRRTYTALLQQTHVHIRTHIMRGVSLTNGIFFHLNIS